MFSCTYVWNVMSCTNWSYSGWVGSSPWRSSHATSRKVAFPRAARSDSRDSAGSRVAIDVRDRAATRCCVEERGIVAEQPALGRRNLAKIVGANRAVGDGQIDAEIGARRRDVQAGRCLDGRWCRRRVAHAESPVPAARWRSGECIVESRNVRGVRTRKAMQDSGERDGRDCMMWGTREDSIDRIHRSLPTSPASMRLATLCLALMGATSLLHAQVPATWVPGNVETRSHDYDLVAPAHRAARHQLGFHLAERPGGHYARGQARGARLRDPRCIHWYHDHRGHGCGRTHAPHEPLGRHAGGPSREAAPLRRHHALHARLSRPHRQRPRPHLHLRRRPPAPPAAALEHGRDHGKQRVVPRPTISRTTRRAGSCSPRFPRA